MKKIICVALPIFVAINIFAQPSKKSLSQQLWDKVLPCFEWAGEDWKEYASIIDDSKNGYLHVSAALPTCGCVHEHTVAAYTNKGGGYTFLEKEEGHCESQYKMFSNRPLEEILPEGFGVKNFMPKFNAQNINQAFFYLDVGIPRQGTDTKMTIKLIPFGTNLKNHNVLLYEHSGRESENSKMAARSVQYIASHIKNTETLQFLINAEYSKISASDMLTVEKYIMKEEWHSFKSINELSDFLKSLKKAYDLSTLIEYRSCILGWDINKNQFYLKSKVKADKIPSFRAFLEKGEYLNDMC